jgi:hypothetical protein
MRGIPKIRGLGWICSQTHILETHVPRPRALPIINSLLCILDMKSSLTYHFELVCNLLSPLDIVIGTVLWTAEVCFVEWLHQVSLQHLFKIRISFIEWKRDWFVDQLCAQMYMQCGDSFGFGCCQNLLIKQVSKFVWWTNSATTLSWEVFCQYVFSLFKPWMG